MDMALPLDSGDKLDQLHAYLNKNGLNDERLLSGVRLSDSGYQKVARKLGIEPREVELYLRALVTRIREEQDRVNEMVSEFQEAIDPVVRFNDNDGRFSYEVDLYKNVTIHDTETQRDTFVRGTEAAAILQRIAAGADEQQVLAQYANRGGGGIQQAERAMTYEQEDPTREKPHFEALKETGFYGKQGAGCIILAQETGRVLLAHRSAMVMEPNTWGCWGGAIDDGEDLLQAAIREVYEEAGYDGEIVAVEPLHVFTKGNFRYHNFLVVVPKEFSPHLNWESQGSEWCKIGQWPQPLHFGLKSLFGDAASMAKIKAAVGTAEEQTFESVMASLREMGALYEAKTADEDGSFHDEIHSPHGSYNFPWKVQDQRGFATARFKGRGKEMKITVLSIRDHDGEPVEADDNLSKIVEEQAIAFIGQE